MCIRDRVLLIRHGQTEWSLTDRHTGRTDIDLTAKGEHDAATLDGVLDRLGLIDPYVIVSPRRRAQRTAKLAGLRADEITEAVAEWDYGDFEGLTRVQIHADHDPDWAIWTSGAPHGESVDAMTRRVDEAVAMVAGHLADHDVVIVSHGHFSRSFICRFLGWPIAFGANVDLRPAGTAMLADVAGDRRITHLVGPEGASLSTTAL